jgi:hypothetical protein
MFMARHRIEAANLRTRKKIILVLAGRRLAGTLAPPKRKLFRRQLHARSGHRFCGLGFCGFLYVDGRRFAFDVFLAALAFDGFVQLFAHKCLYFFRVMRFCVPTMKVCARRFNVYFAVMAIAMSLCGCQTGHQDKADKKTSALRVHIETNPGLEGTSQTITVLRSDPVVLTIAPDPILTEASIIAARVIETPGGFAIEIRFDEMGATTLEQFTATNPGLHLAIYGQWGDKLANGRWLAAPLITHRIGDGVLAFTPDASHEEADELVLGLNNVAKKIQKGLLK